MIPGSQWTSYGGAALVDDAVAASTPGGSPAIAKATRDETPSAVRASGQLFQISVNTYDSAATILGFDLLYNQVPCGGTGNPLD